MRKKWFYGLCAVLTAAALLMGACKQPTDDPPAGDAVSVDTVSITGTGGAINEKSLSMYAGATLALSATVLPADATNKDVSWETSDAGIATVDKGVITAKAEGTAKITVTTAGKKADGNPATNWVDIKVEYHPDNIPAVLTLYNQANPPVEGTTTTLPEFTGTGRLVINNVTSATGWGTNYNQVTGNTIVYLAKPLAAPYEISARIKISEAHRDPQTDNGVIIAAFTDPKVDTSQATAAENAILFAGLANATTGRKRMYTSRASDNTNSSVGDGEYTDANIGKEYVFTVTRRGDTDQDGFEMTVVDDALDPAVTKLNGTRSTADNQTHTKLRSADNTPVYLGFIISGVKAEISSIVIKQGADMEPLYSSPVATPTPRPTVTGLAVTNTELTVNVEAFLQMTAAVTPEGADDRLTWSIDPANDAVATIDANSGLLSGLTAGTVTVYATSVADPTIKSAGVTVTVEDIQEVLENNRSWNFQTLPAGWTSGSNTSNNPYPADYYYGQGMTLLSSIRTMQVNPTSGAPSGTEFSNGFLQPNGAAANGYVKIDDVQGPFDITLNYCSNSGDANGRYPSIKFGDEAATHGDGSTSTSTPKTYKASYTGTDKITVLIVGEVHPGRLYDVIIEYKGQ